MSCRKMVSSSRRWTAWSCLTLAIALGSCGRESATALDLHLMVTGEIDQVEVRSVLVNGAALDLTSEQRLFPTTPRSLATGDVLTLWFADSASGAMVTVSAVGLRCGQTVTDVVTTLPRTLAKAQTTQVDLALAVNRSAGCDGGGQDVPIGSGSGGGGGNAAGGHSGTGGNGGGSGIGGQPMTDGGQGTGGASGSGGSGIGGGTGAGGTTGAGGLGTGGGTGTGGRGTGGAITGGTGGGTGTKINGSPCGGGSECTSGNCVDSVCCDTPLSGCSGCKACNLSSSPGSCANVTSGTDPHGACPASASNCAAGGCTAGACTPAANTTVCSSACASTNQLTTKLCNGVTVGCTNAPATSSCAGNLVCASATACNPNCTAGGDSACLTTHYCSGGTCVLKLIDGQPCTAANQCSSGVCGSFHRDADSDTFGAAAVTRLCGSAVPPGYVTDASDCCDADANVKPGQTTYFITGSAACGGTFDYNCANGPEPQYGTDIGGCSTEGQCTSADPYRCVTSTGWQTAAPDCGGSGMFVTACTRAGGDCNVNCMGDPGACGRGCVGGPTTVNRTQGCR